MGNDDSTQPQMPDFACDELIRQAVEPIPAQPGIVQGARDRVARRERVERAVERRVEARDLRQPGPMPGDLAHRLEVLRLVQRRPRDQPLHRRHGVVVDPLRPAKSPPCTTRWPTAASRSPPRWASAKAIACVGGDEPTRSSAMAWPDASRTLKRGWSGSTFTAPRSTARPDASNSATFKLDEPALSVRTARSPMPHLTQAAAGSCKTIR